MERWWHKPVNCIITTLCIAFLMLLTASDPSADDAVRGAGGGAIGWLLANLVGKK